MPVIVSPEKLNGLLRKATAWLSIYVVFYAAFGGMINYALINTHTLFVNNIAGVVTIGLFAAYVFVSVVRLSMEKFMLLLTLVIGIFLVYALFDHLSFWQNAFGFYLWTTFLLGALLCVYAEEEAFFRCMPVLWACSVAGIFLNYFVDLPWIGQSYESHGLTQQAAKKWSAFGGYDRLAGFSRANYSAAVIILVSSCYFLTSKRFSSLVKAAVYALSCLAIFLTTSKTDLGAIVLVLPFLYTCKALRVFLPRTKFDFYFARAAVVIMAALVVMLPLTLSTHDAPKNASGPSFMFLTADTLIERATWMWPDAFDLLAKDGSIFIGRGIGGVGIALGMKDPVPDEVNAADNLFVHVYVEGGLLLALPFFLSFLGSWRKLYERGPEYFDLIWILAFCTMNIGITTGCVEDPMLMILLGFFVARGYGCGDRFREKKT